MDILRVLPPSVLRLDALRIEPALQSFHRAAA
jgi:hypothetical protein